MRGGIQKKGNNYYAVVYDGVDPGTGKKRRTWVPAGRRRSDAFGFDLVSWLPLTPGASPTAVCLEVKSSSGEGFHLANSEWLLARCLHDAGEGNRYAVLVVRRGKRRGLPSTVDLLVDPVGLFESGQLRGDVDGYKIAYRANEGLGGLAGTV